MVCEDEYAELTRLTERLHELYYQQESVQFSFSTALANAQTYLIATGLVKIMDATASEIVNALEDWGKEGFSELHDVAARKVQIDSAVASTEESYRDASRRYEECIKRHSSQT